MRIGKLSNANIQTWEPSRKRSIVSKDVPLFAQSLYYDLVIENWQLKITGFLGSNISMADLASQIANFNSIVKSRQVLWIDVSDNYNQQLYLCRITDITGPTLDSSKGTLEAEFSITALILLPWGTTHFNPYSTQSGVVLRDLSGQGREWILNPLTMNCNFMMSNAGTASESFSWEFIVDNQNPFTNALSSQWNSCDFSGGGLLTSTQGASAPATVTFVQAAAKNPYPGSPDGSASSPLSKAFGSNVTSGNVLVAFFCALDGKPSSVTFSDSKSFTWSVAKSGNNPNNGLCYVSVAWAMATASGADTVSVTYSGGTSPTYTSLFIYEFHPGGTLTSSNFQTSTGFGTNASNTTPFTAKVGAISPSSSSGVGIVGTYSVGSFNTATAGSGFTMVPGYSGSTGNSSQYASNWTSGATTCPVNYAGGGYWFGIALIINGYQSAQVVSGSVDNATFQEGSGSYTLNITSPLASMYYFVGTYKYNWGTTTTTSGVDLSGYDRLRAWVKCSQTGQALYYLQMNDAAGLLQQWYFSLAAANTWQQVLVSISKPSLTQTGFDITNVKSIFFVILTASTPPATLQMWIDDIRNEVGYINHCEDSSGFVANGGTGVTFLNDPVIYKNSQAQIVGLIKPSLVNTSFSTIVANLGSPQAETTPPASLRETGTSTAGGVLGWNYSFPVSNWDVSGYDFLLLWVRSDFGLSSTGTINVLLGDMTTNYFTWTYSSLAANEWYRLVIPLRNPTNITGTPALNNLAKLSVQSTGAINAATNLWVDEIAADIGNPVTLEFHVPDNIAQTNPDPIISWSWNGSSYQILMEEDAFGNEYVPDLYFLDGANNKGSVIYSGQSGGASYFIIGYPPGTIGSVATQSAITTSPVQYTRGWGTRNRCALMIRLPPATSDSITGNLPSNDLSGFLAINKARLKVQIYCANEDTSYTGF
jgi:hypothetical protein